MKARFVEMIAKLSRVGALADAKAGDWAIQRPSARAPTGRVVRAVVILAAVTGAAVSRAESVSLGSYSHAARQELENRVRKALSEDSEEGTVAGTVTCSANDAFFIQGKEEALKVVVERGGLPASGDTVEAKGRPALEGGRVVFLARTWKKTGTAVLPAPRPVDSADLLFAGEGKGARKRDVNWLLVEVRGRAMATTESGFAVEVDGLPVTVAMENLPGFLAHCEKTHPLVTVRGVAEMILDQSVLFNRSRRVMGVKLCACGDDAVTLEPDAVYLVNCRDRRVMFLIGALIVALTLGLLALFVFALRQARRQLRTKTLMDERKRMADDIHDTIEQHLVGAGMFIQLGRDKEAREILVRAKKELRDIIWGLKNDDMMRLSPAEMVREIAHKETKKGLYRVTARLEWMPETLDASKMRDLSLIVREAIGNAVKHGGAKKIAITSDSKPDGGWLLRIANDGLPFDEKSSPGVKEGHFGLEGMRERGRRLGAEVTFSSKGDWTVVAVDVKG